MPIFLDEYFVAIILAFSASMADLCRRFRVPDDMQGNDGLVVTLIPWALSNEQKKKEWRKSHNAIDFPNHPLTVNDRGNILRFKSEYRRAMSGLKFPRKLYDYMSQPNRSYCVWSLGGDGSTDRPGLETQWLLSILELCRAKNLGLKSDARVVFVHVGAMKTLHSLPLLVEKRSRRPEIQFHTYGTHQTVPPERWGVHEIFPLGMSGFMSSVDRKLLLL